MAYILTGIALPDPLTDVIGIVEDDDGLTRMLVYRHPDGRWLASQSECDIEFNVIAWSAMPPLPSGGNGLIWNTSRTQLGWISAAERPRCGHCTHRRRLAIPFGKVRNCRLGGFATEADAVCDHYQEEAD